MNDADDEQFEYEREEISEYEENEAFSLSGAAYMTLVAGLAPEIVATATMRILSTKDADECIHGMLALARGVQVARRAASDAMVRLSDDVNGTAVAMKLTAEEEFLSGTTEADVDAAFRALKPRYALFVLFARTIWMSKEPVSRWGIPDMDLLTAANAWIEDPEAALPKLTRVLRGYGLTDHEIAIATGAANGPAVVSFADGDPMVLPWP